MSTANSWSDSYDRFIDSSNYTNKLQAAKDLFDVVSRDNYSKV